MALIKVVLGDITKQSVDVIVTAANESLLGGVGLTGRSIALRDRDWPRPAQRSLRAIRVMRWQHRPLTWTRR